MKQIKRWLCVGLAVVCCLLVSCADRMPPQEEPAPPVSQSPGGEEPPAASPPAETGEPPEGLFSESLPTESPPALVLDRPYEVTETAEDGTSFVHRYSALNYSLRYPLGAVTVTDWGEGETYGLEGAEGTYLAVSRVDAPGMSTVAEALQFEYPMDGEPLGCLFGAEGYAGMKMTLTGEELYMEFILCEEKGTIYLVELALYTADDGGEDLLRAMLDTVTFD